MHSYMVKLLFFLCLIAVGLFSFLWYLPLIKNNEELQKKLIATEKKLQQTNAQYEKLRMECSALKNNPLSIEKYMREHYRYARTNETIFIFND